MDEDIFPLYQDLGDDIGHVRLLDRMGDDLRVVNAARVSFGRTVAEFSDNDDRLLRFLLRNKHTSPFEHCMISWAFKVPLFVRSQHMRHRTWSFNEISRRYTSETIEFYLPNRFRKQHSSDRQASTNEHINPLVTRLHKKQNANTALKEASLEAVALYENLLAQGVAREMARMVLPQNLYTSYYGTIDLHNALRFIELRSDYHAQWEIRRVAEAMHEQLKKLFPAVMRAWEDNR